MGAAPKLFTVYDEGSNVPRPLPTGEWLDYMHSLIKEPYTAEEVERFIRCCEANRTRLAHDPQTKSNLMARVDAALDAPAMGGQYPPDRLIDYVFDVLNPVAPTSAKTWDSAAAAVSGEMEAKAASGTSEDRALKGDGSELGVIGADGSRRILDAEAARKAA